MTYEEYLLKDQSLIYKFPHLFRRSSITPIQNMPMTTSNSKVRLMLKHLEQKFIKLLQWMSWTGGTSITNTYSESAIRPQILVGFSCTILLFHKHACLYWGGRRMNGH